MRSLSVTCGVHSSAFVPDGTPPLSPLTPPPQSFQNWRTRCYFLRLQKLGTKYTKAPLVQQPECQTQQKDEHSQYFVGTVFFTPEPMERIRRRRRSDRCSTVASLHIGGSNNLSVDYTNCAGGQRGTHACHVPSSGMCELKRRKTCDNDQGNIPTHATMLHGKWKELNPCRGV